MNSLRGVEMHIGEAGFIDRRGISHFVESLETSSRGRSLFVGAL